MLDKIKPPLILTLICIVISSLLVGAYKLTYVDTTGVITDKLQEGLTELFGEGEYKMLMNEDGTVQNYEGITSIITNEDKEIAMELTVDGYAKGGLHLLIGFDLDGKLSGISIISIGETPGLGTKVENSSYQEQFIGKDNSDFKADNLTGATFSSKGMENGVKLAIDTYNEHKEDIIGE